MTKKQLLSPEKNHENPFPPGNWYKVDFHVHSPASYDFYGSDPDVSKDEIYAGFLKKLHEAELQVVVIADHNEIAGYSKIMELKSDYESTKRTLDRIKEATPANIKNQLDIFSEVIFLPGTELDVYPNLHLIVIFDPSNQIEEIEKFLENAGYPEKVRRQKEASGYAKWTIQDVCLEAGKLGAIVVAAHVDSDKGLYEETKKWGQKRIAAFTDENLYAMEFNNPKARDQIESILKTKEYSRDTRLSFVQSSDYHGSPEEVLGEKASWIRLDVKDHNPHDFFEEMKKALRNPDEYVSAPGRPEIKAIQSRLADNPSVAGINTDEAIDKLIQYICAYANTEDGTFVIGRNNQGNWIGIVGDDEGITEKISNLVEKTITPPPAYSTEIYPYYGNKCFATIRVRHGILVHSVVKDDRVYVIKDNVPALATTDNIVQLAEENFLQRYSYLSITNRLSEISQRLSGSRDSLDILPIVRKIEAKTIPLFKLFGPPTSGNLLPRDLKQSVTKAMVNGLVFGNTIVLDPTKPRREHNYVRFTAPKYNLDFSSQDLSAFTQYSGRKIIVVPRGAVYYDEQDDVIVLCDQWKPLILQYNDQYTGPNPKYVAAYLKTAIPIWYSDRCLGSPDIRRSDILRKIPVPNSPTDQEIEQVLDLSDKLISLEYDFLTQEQKFMQELPEDDEMKDEFFRQRREIVDKHNSDAENLIANLDSTFFSMLELTSEETSIIQDGLKSIGLAVFN